MNDVLPADRSPLPVRVAVIDYAICNVRSVEKAFRKVGVEVEVVVLPDTLSAFTHWVLPGVGTFSEGMDNLHRRGFVEPLRRAAANGVPLLGICLGMQLMAERGTEGQACAGLGILPGVVHKLTAAAGLRIPHVGWNDCLIRAPGSVVDIAPRDPVFYFLHSYHLVLRDASLATAWCTYGEGFTAAVEKNNVMGCQFHPEKSQGAGLAVLENFLRRRPASESKGGKNA